MYRLASLLAAFLLMAVTPVLADIRGTDAMGKPVILRSDGTWDYIVGGGTGPTGIYAALGKPCAANRAFVASLYRSILDRQPDAAGLDYWTGRLNSGQTKKWLIAQIFKSREYTGHRKSNREFVRDAYQAILGRQPEPAGHANWIKNLNNNMPRNVMIGHFLKSTEYARKMARCGVGSGGGQGGVVGTGPGGNTLFLGCYIDKPDRDVQGHFFSDSRMTTQLCINTCRTKGYRIASTQFASQCFCGNTYGRYGKVAKSQCNYDCAGNANEKCGASWRNSVYKIGAGGITPPPLPQLKRTFVNPKWNGHIVDNCVTWATNCGGGGAHNFCRKKGYAKASKWVHNRPGTTWVIGSNKVCRGDFCVGYGSITCTR